MRKDLGKILFPRSPSWEMFVNPHDCVILFYSIIQSNYSHRPILNVPHWLKLCARILCPYCLPFKTPLTGTSRLYIYVVKKKELALFKLSV